MEESCRCQWCGSDPVYIDYHDHVWGRPVSGSRELFEKLCLDGQQAGLSWITILKKQQNYRAAIADFDPRQIAEFDEKMVTRLLQNKGIIRNRLKIQAIIKNANAYLALRQQGVDFARFLWSFTGGKPIVNAYPSGLEVPANTVESDRMSKALKKAGFSFVGSTICYAFMQTVGMVNDHTTNCFAYSECARQQREFSL